MEHGGHREAFLIELGHHLDAQALSDKVELAQALRSAATAVSDIAHDPTHSLNEAVEIAEIHGFDSHGWVDRRESALLGLARRYNREQVARQALKNMDSYLRQIVYTVARPNAAEKFTPAEREQVINRLAGELQAEVDTLRASTTPPVTWST